jgi:hypothetical protein
MLLDACQLAGIILAPVGVAWGFFKAPVEGCAFLILAAVLYMGPVAIFYLRSISEAQTILLHRMFPRSAGARSPSADSGPAPTP